MREGKGLKFLILKNFDDYFGKFAGNQEWPAELKELFFGNAQNFLYPIDRFAAHLIIKFPPWELQ